MTGSKSVAILIAAFIFCGIGGFSAHLTRGIFTGRGELRPLAPPPPKINYQTPQVYKVNVSIQPLSPKSTGGPVPGNPYAYVSTIAGADVPGAVNGTGTTASFNQPQGIAIDNAGNIYVADNGNNLIRKITPDGIVTTFAGSGAVGGANGIGTAASFNSPSALAIDAAGNVYVADAGNNQIRKITPQGTVSVFAGSGIKGYANGTGIAAQFDNPYGITIDAGGNLYIGDTGNHRIRKITPSAVVSTIAGNGNEQVVDGVGGAASIGYPGPLAIDKDGNIYFSNGFMVIKKLSAALKVTTFAGTGSYGSANGQGSSASFNSINNITVDRLGNLYVADGGNNLIRKITPGGLVSTLAGTGNNGEGNGIALNANFRGPFGIAYDPDGFLYVSDLLNSHIRKITLTGYIIDKPLPPGLNFDAATGTISGVPAVEWPATDYYITAYNNGGESIAKVNIKVVPNSTPVLIEPAITYTTPNVYKPGKTINPLSPNNNAGAVASNGTGLLMRQTITPANFGLSRCLATDKSGNIYCANTDNQIVKILPGGKATILAGAYQGFGNQDGTAQQATFYHPFGIAVDPSGNVYVADWGTNLIRKITPAGNVTTLAGTPGANESKDGKGANASFVGVEAITADNNGNLYIADGCMIRKITPAGVVTTLAGTQQPGRADGTGAAARFYSPQGLAVDQAGNVYVADTQNQIIRKITPGGVVTTIAGNGDLSKNDGDAKSAGFSYPQHIAVDKAGNIYVTDQGNSEVRRITAGSVSTVVGNGIYGDVDGVGQAAEIAIPGDIAIDKDGNLLVDDGFNGSIYKIQVTNYTIDKPLPPGMLFDTTTGVISGTPTGTWPATQYIVTAFNTSGSSTTTLSIEVRDDTAEILPPKISYLTPQNYIVGRTIATLTPRNDGGLVPQTVYGAVTVLAGNGQKGNANGTGTIAGFNTPTAVATDPTGNIYVADKANNLIRKITPDGHTTTFAGNGTPAVVSGKGAAASFNGPGGIATDAAGNIYVADTEGNVIRKITPDGTVTTLAGTGAAGDDNGAPGTATFNKPLGIAVDNTGFVYVTEEGSCLIRKISTSGNVSRFAGGNCGNTVGTTLTAMFSHPQGLAVDRVGNIYVADYGNNRVCKIDAAGKVTAFLRSNRFFNFQGLAGVALDSQGNLYVSDSGNNQIIKVEAGTNTISALTGENSGLNLPLGVATDGNGNLYVANSNANNIVKVTLTGYQLDKPLPAGLVFDKTTGVINGTPTQAYQVTPFTVTAYNAGGKSSFAIEITVQLQNTPGNPPNISYDSPQTYYINQDIAPLPPKSTGSEIPALEFGLIMTYSGSGNPGYKEGGPTSVLYRQPAGVALDASGNLYIADYLNNVIRKVDPNGASSTLAGSGQGTFTDGKGANANFNGPGSIAISASGDLYVADALNNRIRKITPDGTVTTFAGSAFTGHTDGTGTAASFNLPTGIAIDAAGYLYVADSGNNLIRKISPSGEVSTLAGSGSPGSSDGNTTNATFNAPQNLTVDADGNVYVTDMGNNLIRKITSAGDVTTYAGNGSAGAQNGPALQASFNKPSGIVVDNIGDLFITDFGANLIRMINPAGEVITLAGDGSSNGLNNTGTAASFNGPKGLALDANRKLYIADSFDNNIRTAVTIGYRIGKPLPSGMSFSNSTGIISGKPNILSPLTNYPITGYNVYGSSKTSVDIEVVNTQTIAFAPIPPKMFCDKDFDPGATSTAQITYTSSDENVAKIINNKIHIVGAGTTTITASDGTSAFPQTLTVTAAVVPSVTISPASADDCAGNTVTYKATPVNGGDTPHYQWLVDGQPAGGDSPVFAVNSLANSDKITCVLTSSACTISALATSNEAVFTLDPPLTTAVTIASSLTGPVCAGTEITFTATPTLPDLATVYQWQINGNNAGSNSAMFTTKTLADGDIVTCIVTSQGKCLVTPAVTSNAITVHFNPVSQCVISIPNTFTPNGDGINDLWNITALAYYPDCTLNVYSRYGSVVYKSVGYGTPWDGTSGGRALPVGTYYYILDLKNGKKPISGAITILK